MDNISPFTHIYRKGNYLLLFNPLTLEKHYLHKKDYSKIFKNKDLIKKGLIVGEDFNDDSYFNKIKKDILKWQRKPRISLCYLLLTGDCNYNCKYCFIESNLKEKNTYMTPETAKKAIEFFKKNIDPEIKTKKIYFYGGEPLLNFQALKVAVEEARIQIPEANLIIITNGALLTKEIAEFLAKNKVHIGISMDGPNKLNDKARITYKSNEGSSDLTLRGINILKKLSINLSISCTIGQHNIDNIENVMKYFINELGVKGIEFNIPKPTKYTKGLDPKRVAEQMIRSFEIAWVNDLSIDRIKRRKVIPFATKKPWIKDCAGYGQQIIVTPEGRVGPCHAFWPLNKFLNLTVDSDMKVIEHEDWKEWNKRVAYNEPRCKYCEAISLCGGGCAFNHYNEQEGIWNLDKTTCEFAKEVLNWLVWAYFEHRYYEEINSENKKLIIKMPSWTDDKRYNAFLKKVTDGKLLKDYSDINKIIKSIYEDKERFLFILDKTELVGIAYGNPIKYIFLKEYEDDGLINYASNKLKELNKKYLTGEDKQKNEL